MSALERAEDMAEKDGFSSAVTWLSGGLVLLTVTLTAVGGATGGIARMFRNSDNLYISGALALVLCGVLLAVCANLPDRNAASEEKKKRNVFVAALSLGVSMVAFGLGLFWTLNLMINTTQEDDRPTLNGQLVVDENAGWQLKIQASASGLRAEDRLQVLVYGQPQAGQGPNPSGAASATPAPAPTASGAYLDGDRMLFMQSGSNIDGLAEQSLEIPIPDLPRYQTIVVTAVIGDYPRNCAGQHVNVRDNTEAVVPPEQPRETPKPKVEKSNPPKNPNDGTKLSCLTFAAPPLLTPEGGSSTD
jgi:hypothetical protein